MTVRSTRIRVLALLDIPRCPNEVRERIPGTSRKQIESVIRRLARDRLIVCVTPAARQSRLYGRSYLANMLLSEIIGVEVERTAKLSERDLRLRVFLQAGRYRRLVLRAMPDRNEPPMTARDIRRSVLTVHQRISAGHVHSVLRSFKQRGIATKDGSDRTWRLTALGARLREYELDGLLERPSGPMTAWGRALGRSASTGKPA